MKILNQFFLLLIMVLGQMSVASEYPDEGYQESLQRFAEVHGAELDLGVKVKHRSTFYLQKDSSENYLKTELVVGGLHGLLNSPRYTQALAETLFEEGHNVINARLDGHFERRRKRLDEVPYSHWFNNARDVLKISTGVGQKVILFGHSTGALSVSVAALENPDQVSGLVLLSPAFDLKKNLKRLVKLSKYGVSGYILDLFRASFGIPRGNSRYISSYAGAQVLKGIDQFEMKLQNASDSKRRKFLNIPMLVIDTANDKVVDIQASKDFFSLGTHKLNKRVILPEELKISHNRVPSGGKYAAPSPYYPIVFGHIVRFIERVAESGQP